MLRNGYSELTGGEGGVSGKTTLLISHKSFLSFICPFSHRSHPLPQQHTGKHILSPSKQISVCGNQMAAFLRLHVMCPSDLKVTGKTSALKMYNTHCGCYCATQWSISVTRTIDMAQYSGAQYIDHKGGAGRCNKLQTLL